MLHTGPLNMTDRALTGFCFISNFTFFSPNNHKNPNSAAPFFSTIKTPKCHTAITFLPAQLTSVNLIAAFPPFFPPTLPHSIKRRAKSSSATLHFEAAWRGRVQRLNRSSLHTPTPALASPSCGTGVSLKQLNSTPRTKAGGWRRGEKKRKNTPNCSPLRSADRPEHSLLLYLSRRIFPPVTAGRGLGASSQAPLLWQ